MKTLILICFSLNLCFGQKITNISTTGIEFTVRMWKHGNLVSEFSLKPGESGVIPISFIINPWMEPVLVQLKVEERFILGDLGAWIIKDGWLNLLLNYDLLKSLGTWKFDGVDLNFKEIDSTERA